MGTRGINEKAHDFVGSVTAEVVEISPVPVLAIHKDITHKQLQKRCKLAFVTNLEERDFTSYHHLLHLPEFNDKEMLFLVISDKLDASRREDAKQALDRYLKSEPFMLDFLDARDLLQSILHQVTLNEIDIVIIPTHKRNLFVRLFRPSMAHQVVFNSDIALLAIHD